MSPYPVGIGFMIMMIFLRVTLCDPLLTKSEPAFTCRVRNFFPYLLLIMFASSSDCSLVLAALGLGLGLGTAGIVYVAVSRSVKERIILVTIRGRKPQIFFQKSFRFEFNLNI